MIYTLENTVKVGKRCSIFSAGNVEIMDVIYADTDTGEVHQLHRIDGRAQVVNHRAEFLKKWFPAPLKVVFNK